VPLWPARLRGLLMAGGRRFVVEWSRVDDFAHTFTDVELAAALGIPVDELPDNPLGMYPLDYEQILTELEHPDDERGAVIGCSDRSVIWRIKPARPVVACGHEFADADVEAAAVRAAAIGSLADLDARAAEIRAERVEAQPAGAGQATTRTVPRLVRVRPPKGVMTEPVEAELVEDDSTRPTVVKVIYAESRTGAWVARGRIVEDTEAG
jgi:hypothetical protein